MLVLLFLFWLILSGKLTVEIVAFGVPISLAVWFFACRALGWNLRRELLFYRLAPHAAAYAAVLLFEIVKSAFAVVPYIFGRAPAGAEVRFESPLKSDAANAALANSITLTPGTITVSAEKGVFTVHCLSPAFAEGLLSSSFVRRLRRMEEIAGKMNEGGTKK